MNARQAARLAAFGGRYAPGSMGSIGYLGGLATAAETAASIEKLRTLGYAPPDTSNPLDPALMVVVKQFQVDNKGLLANIASSPPPGADVDCGAEDGKLGTCVLIAIDAALKGGAWPPPGPPAPKPPPDTPPVTPPPDTPSSPSGPIVWIKAHPWWTAIIVGGVVVAVIVYRNREQIVNVYAPAAKRAASAAKPHLKAAGRAAVGAARTPSRLPPKRINVQVST